MHYTVTGRRYYCSGVLVSDTTYAYRLDLNLCDRRCLAPVTDIDSTVLYPPFATDASNP